MCNSLSLLALCGSNSSSDLLLWKLGLLETYIDNINPLFHVFLARSLQYVHVLNVISLFLQVFVSLSKGNFPFCFPLVEKDGGRRNKKTLSAYKKKGKKLKSHALTMFAKANWSGCCLFSCLQIRKSCWKLAQTTSRDAWLFSGFGSHSETLWARAFFMHCSRKWILGSPLG